MTFSNPNYVTEKGCGGVASQLWKSVEQSNGTWTIKNNYLGTGECLQDMGRNNPVEMETCVAGEANQEWSATEVVAMGANQ